MIKMIMSNKWEWHYTKDKLPEPYKACVIWVPNRPWEWEEVGSGIFYKVAIFVPGLSLKEREKMKECKRKHEWYKYDEGSGNNAVPYGWEEFGPDFYFGQEVIAWTYIEEIKK